MKRTILSLCAVAMASLCSAQNSVTVKVTDANSDTLFVRMSDKELRRAESMDTLVSKSREFTIAKNLNEVHLAVIGNNAGQRSMLFLVPGESCVISLNDGVKDGSSAFYTESERVSGLADAEVEKLSKEYGAKAEAGADRDSLRKAYAPLMEAASAKAVAARLDYIKANPSSNVSVALLYDMEDYEEGLKALSAEVRNGIFSGVVASMQAQVDKEKARKEAAKYVADGCEAPDFTLKDINGKDLSLSSLRGKYVVLDFWGSWCIWCIRGIPEMKKYYEKYSSKMEILGVDCNDTEQKWKAAVEKHQIPWKHVYNPRTSDLTKKYAVQGFPTKIVIDPQGKIVKTVVGEDPAFYTFLDDILGK